MIFLLLLEGGSIAMFHSNSDERPADKVLDRAEMGDLIIETREDSNGVQYIVFRDRSESQDPAPVVRDPSRFAHLN